MEMFKRTLWQDETHSTAYTEYSSREKGRDQSQNDLTKFKGLPRSLVIAVLDNCNEELTLMQHYIQEHVEPSWKELIGYRSPQERFLEDDPEERTKQIEGIPFTDHQKLQKDLCFIINAITATYFEIDKKGKFGKLIDVLNTIECLNRDNAQIMEEQYSSMAKLKSTQEMFAKDRSVLMREIEAIDNHLYELVLCYEDKHEYKNQERRYINTWETTRELLNTRILNEQEDDFNKQIQDSKNKIAIEERVHTEMVNFVTENREEYEDEIQYWMNRYDDDMERLENETMKTKGKWEDLSSRHTKLSNAYKEHKQFIEDWLQFKEERRLAEELLKLQIICAIKIQAWWRMLMVKRRLGSFAKFFKILIRDYKLRLAEMQKADPKGKKK